MITGIEHFGICAQEPKALADWYIDHLDFRLVKELEEHRTYFIRAVNGVMVEIYPAKHPMQPIDNVHQGLRHLALSVTSVQAMSERLRLAGTEVPENTIVRTAAMQLAFFRDPEGNLLHLVERKEAIP